MVAPENEFLLQHVRSFFKELSTVYELCRLGRHVPIKPLRDGILRIGRNAAQKVLHESVDDWFNLLGEGGFVVVVCFLCLLKKCLFRPFYINLKSRE